MSRTVTLGQIWSLARRLANVEGDPNITDAELTTLANVHVPEVWDELVDANEPDYFASSTTVSSLSGVTGYALLVDFRNLLGVYANETTDQRRPILPMKPGERGKYRAPTSNGIVFTVDYVPAAPVFAGTSGETFDGISGFEKLIANLMARDIVIKREGDPSAVMATIDRERARISSTGSNRDKGQPKRVVDLDQVTENGTPWGWYAATRINAYRLRGSTLELFEPLWGLP